MLKSKSLSSVVGRSWMLERKESSKDADEVEQPAASNQQQQQQHRRLVSSNENGWLGLERRQRRWGVWSNERDLEGARERVGRCQKVEKAVLEIPWLGPSRVKIQNLLV